MGVDRVGFSPRKNCWQSFFCRAEGKCGDRDWTNRDIGESRDILQNKDGQVLHEDSKNYLEILYINIYLLP